MNPDAVTEIDEELVEAGLMDPEVVANEGELRAVSIRGVKELSPEEILKKDIKSLETQAKHSKNPMEQRQLRQKIGRLQMKLKYKDFGMF
jgi:hypothetical protein